MLFYYLTLLCLCIYFIVFAFKNNLFKTAPIYMAYCLSFIILNVIGSFAVFFPENQIFGSFEVYNKSTNYINIFFYILLIQCISFFIFNSFHKQNPFVANKNQNENVYNYLFVLSMLSILIVLIYFIQNGLPPFFTTSFFQLGNDLIVERRSDFLSQVNNFWIFQLGFYFIPQILCAILLCKYYNNRSNFNRNLFLTYFLFSVILSLSFLQKNPLIVLLIQMFSVSLLLENKISFKAIFLAFLSIFSSIYLLYYIAFASQQFISFSFIVTAIFQRIVGVYPLSLSLVPDLVYHYGFYNGATAINPLGIFDFEQVNLSEELHLLIYGFVSNAPAPAIGYAFSDFGFIGVLAFILISNIVIYLYQYFFNKINSNMIKIAFTSFMMTQAIYLAMTSIYDSLLNPTYIVLMLIMLGIYYILPEIKGEPRKI